MLWCYAEKRSSQVGKREGEQLVSPNVILQHSRTLLQDPKQQHFNTCFPFCIISFPPETNSLCCTNVCRRTELGVSYGHFREVCSSQNQLLEEHLWGLNFEFLAITAIDPFLDCCTCSQIGVWGQWTAQSPLFDCRQCKCFWYRYL